MEALGESREGIAKFIPMLSWLPGNQRDWLRIDIVAGLTTSTMVIPQAMEAYQGMSGDSNEAGIMWGNSITRN